MNGHLASANNDDEMRLIAQYAVNAFAISPEVTEYWLGGYDLNSSGSFNWTVEGNGLDKNWTLDRLIETSGKHFCTSSKLWHDKRFASNCFLSKAYVCVVEASSCTTEAEKTIHERCPTGFIYIEPFHKCYKFFSKSLRFDEAEKSCKNFKAHLISMKSDFERKFLNAYAEEMFPSSVRDYWIGFSSQEIFGSWHWNDHSERIYYNWASGQPSNLLTHQCALMSKSTGEWSSVNCFKEHPYVCALSLDCIPRTRNKVEFTHLRNLLLVFNYYLLS
ncbi:Neurocan core protein [Toxocara canis]|uniref:Neurocan core protein n=1 Tax=Toxocara canis TaxID=6265 RepID=A0A0B2VV47_TOXCA|nr:Neurocan core protein [Toxocara canis]